MARVHRRRHRKVPSVGRNGVNRSTGREVQLADEALGVVLGGLGLFLLLSLLSAALGTNWGGLVGHWLAGGLLTTFGGAALLVVGLLWQAAWLAIVHAPARQRLLAGFGGGLLVIGLAPILHISLAPYPAHTVGAGGVVGQGLYAWLTPYGNTAGTLLSGAVVAGLGSLLVVPPLSPLAIAAKRRWRQWWHAGLRRLRRQLTARPPSTQRRQRQAPPLHPVPLIAALPDTAEAAASLAGEALTLAPPPEPATSRPSALGPSATPPYRKPALSLLDLPPSGKRLGQGIDLAKQAGLLAGKLRDFGVEGRVVQVLPGPVVTMYEFEPASGVKVSRIVNLADDLALGMKALAVRIVAPVPGKSVVGIEIPNPHREPVCLREILASPAFQRTPSKLALALGKDILGSPAVTDLAQIPHLLIAGATGSGKSVGLNSMICSMLINATPDEVKFIMIDPKMLELSVYDGIPHLIAPVVTHPKKAAAALHWAVEEMERRYRLLAEQGVRGIDGYNQQHPERPLPYIVMVIDELADLMLVARRDVEDSLTRLAQMARAAGMHLLVATQRPSVDVLTGIIKANFPARLSFQVSSRTDSRTILDSIGAERLLGKGDMLFLPPGTSKLLRIHGAYVSEAEIKRLVDAWRGQQAPAYEVSSFTVASEESDEPEAYDDKYDAAVALVVRVGHASASLIQRHLRIGYNRAARLIETMEREGVVGPADGSRPREVYIKAIQERP